MLAVNPRRRAVGIDLVVLVAIEDLDFEKPHEEHAAVAALAPDAVCRRRLAEFQMQLQVAEFPRGPDVRICSRLEDIQSLT